MLSLLLQVALSDNGRSSSATRAWRPNTLDGGALLRAQHSIAAPSCEHSGSGQHGWPAPTCCAYVEAAVTPAA